MFADITIAAGGILAQIGDAAVDEGAGILDGALGTPIKAIFAAIGVLLVVFAIAKSLKDFASGKIGNAVKTIVGGVLAAALCFNLGLVVGIVGAVGGLLSTAVEAFTNLAGGGETAS